MNTWFYEKGNIDFENLTDLLKVAHTPQFGDTENQTLTDFLMCKAFEVRFDPSIAMAYHLAAMIISRVPDNTELSEEANYGVSQEQAKFIGQAAADACTIECLNDKVTALMQECAQHKTKSFAKLYKDNAIGIESERLKMKLENLEAENATLKARLAEIIKADQCWMECYNKVHGITRE